MEQLTLILLPGMDGTGELFEPIIKEFNARITIQVIRYPDKANWDYSDFEFFVLNQIPKEQDFVLLAESFSGPIAISIAALNLPRLKGLVLCCSFVSSPYPLFSHLKILLPFIPFSLFPQRILSKFMLGRFSNASLRTLFYKAISQLSFDSLRKRLNLVLSVDVSHQIQQVKVPILYLSALEDCLLPKNTVLKISQLAPNIQIVKIEAPHLLLQTVSSKAADIIFNFLDGIN